MPKTVKNFNVDNVRVVKILGGNINESRVVKGMVLGREPESIATRVEKAKVAIFSCPLDTSATETKGTVLIHNAKEMMDFTKGEEKQVEQVNIGYSYIRLLC
jgi:T-complex protein 1 subunit theta